MYVRRSDQAGFCVRMSSATQGSCFNCTAPPRPPQVEEHVQQLHQEQATELPVESTSVPTESASYSTEPSTSTSSEKAEQTTTTSEEIEKLPPAH